MANSFGTETPPAPDNLDGGNALMSAPAPQMGRPTLAGPGQAPQQAMPPPPSHEQTVAALRHFDAVKREIGAILQNPSLGKASVKGKIIDGMTRLVAEGFMKPAGAVDELAKVPSDPLQQLQWAKAMMANAQDAERTILAHHAIGFAGQGPMPTPSADNHLDHLDALAQGFRGSQRG